MDRKNPLWAVIPALAVVLAVIAGAVLYLDPGIFTIRQTPPVPWGGVVSQYDSDILAVDNINLTEIPDAKNFSEVLSQLGEVREIRLAGEIALPDILPMPFKFTVVRNDRMQRCTVTLQAGDKLRGFSLQGEMDSASPVTAHFMTGKITGRLSGTELRQLGSAAGRIHGNTAFNGDFIFSIPEFSLADMVLTGDFEQGSWIDGGFFRMSEPGNFRFKMSGSNWELGLPEAAADLSSVTLSRIELKGNSDSLIGISSRLAMTQFGRLSRNLNLTGSMDMVSGEWSFEAVSPGSVFMTAPIMQIHLNSVKLYGSGNMQGGQVRLSGAGPDFTVRSDDNWHGSDVEFEGFRDLKFPATGKITAVREKMTLKLRKLEFSHGERRITAESPEMIFSGNGKSDSMLHCRLFAANIASRQEGESLAFAKPDLRGDFIFSGGGIALVENFAMNASELTGRRGNMSLKVLSPAVTGGFDRLKKQDGKNFDFLLRGNAVRLSLPGFAVESKSGSWRLLAGLPGGMRRPDTWKHLIELQDGTFDFSPVKGRFLAGSLDFELADTDLSLRSGAVNFSRLEGDCRKKWFFTLTALNGNGTRRLDGWNGALHGQGSVSSGDGRWQLGNMNFNLPFTPGAAAPVTGTLTASGVISPDGLADNLKAELKIADGSLGLNGTTSSSKLSGGFFFNGRIKLDGENRTLEAEYTLPLATLSGTLSGAKISPALGSWNYMGRIGASGSLSAGADGVKHTTEYRFDGRAEFAPWTLDGISGTVKTASGKENPEFGLKFRFADGSAVLKSVDGNGCMIMDVRDVLAEQLIPVPPGTVLGGRYSGEITGRWGKKGFVLESGTLSGGDGVLKLDKLERFRYVPKNANPELLKFSAAAFQGFSVEKSTLRMRRGNKGLDLRILAEGVPLKELPFVYDNGSFRAKREGEFGFSGDVTITSDYRIAD